MKRNSYGVFALLLIFITSSCSFLPDNLNPKTWLSNLQQGKSLTTEDAKVEIRSANQDLTTHKETMLQSKGFSALMYLSDLMNMEEDYQMKSAEFNSTLFKKGMSYSNAFNYLRNINSLKSVSLREDEGMYGIFEYNFSTGTFDLMSESTTTLQFTYPADDAALYSQNNNAVLSVNKLEFAEVTSYEDEYDYSTNTYVSEPTTEYLPINAVLSLSVDNVESLTGTFKASYSSDGMPMSMSSKLEVDDYKINEEYKEKTLSYNAQFSMTKSGGVLIDADVNVVYNSDKSAVKTYEGSSIVGSLKFVGNVNAETIENYIEDYQNAGSEPDLDYLNSQISVEIYTSENNAKIGYLAYYMGYDDETWETVPQLAIVYEDGTYEWLNEVFTISEM